ncbi:acyltransferase family protein [Flavobacterium sangjuense]|uniref:O-acetyltransferase OatA n=1 Tax=Flavobacterium sangjuense TaxID=2518177 RepID=A0A4P7PSJ8_9FLAO|nr:acyltransferase [Flavobacterium sangjuense]QBZ97908.1 O-acetyltransferase OatA [Flavobacterium sangjuense]
MKIKQLFFLNGLNELRAIAALLVVLHHIELNNTINSFHSNFSFSNYFIGNIGQNGVFLFFVLSGFLISYLLLLEKEKNQTIQLKKFFLRRIYRIWPLYYFVFAIAVILIPLLATNFDIFKEDPLSYNQIIDTHNYGIKGILFYLFFMPNVALWSGYLMVGCSQAWSVGVEEQFYLIWPLLILFLNRKIIIRVFLLLFFVFPIAIFLAKNGFIPYPFSVIMVSIPFHFMAIGSIGGYFFFYKKELVERYTKSKFLYALIVMLILLFVSVPVFRIEVQEIVVSLLFLALILCSINDKNPIVFRNKQFAFLGKISYGIYMYHTFVMFLVFPFINKFYTYNQNGFIYNLLIYPLIFIITILISYLSYKYFESKFIEIKDSKYKTV